MFEKVMVFLYQSFFSLLEDCVVYNIEEELAPQ